MPYFDQRKKYTCDDHQSTEYFGNISRVLYIKFPHKVPLNGSGKSGEVNCLALIRVNPSGVLLRFDLNEHQV